jgi:hypothetical protein
VLCVLIVMLFIDLHWHGMTYLYAELCSLDSFDMHNTLDETSDEHREAMDPSTSLATWLVGKASHLLIRYTSLLTVVGGGSSELLRARSLLSKARSIGY